jgi:membrane associated rhomboid family serine protease
MGMTGPVGRSRTPATQAKKRPRWMVGGATILTFVALLYLVELIDQLTRHSLDDNGIRPLQADGLWGVIFAPVLHANWQHLMANTVPLLVLGFLMTLAGLSRFVWATVIVWILGGFGTWLIGNVGSTCGPTDHIGASGLIFGWLAFLLVFGLFVRRVWDIIIGLVVLFAYGGVLLGAMPVLGRCGGVSWQGHLCGAIAGVVAAYMLSAPERKARALKKAGTRSPRLKT